jgi:hypothetical protein
VAACRFDDPAGAVGIETLLVRTRGGAVHHVPLTYRDAPLEGGDAWLVGTCEHSVLGRRWVYDACADPVYAAALASAIFAGSGQAEEFMEVEGRLERREPAMTVTGSGVHGAEMQAVGALRRVVDEDPTLVVTDAVELTVVRIVDGDSRPAGATLTGTWAGSPRAGAVGVCAAELDQTVTPSGLPLRLCASMPLGLPAVSLVNSSLEEGSWPSCCTRRRRPSMATSPGRPATCRG